MQDQTGLALKLALPGPKLNVLIATHWLVQKGPLLQGVQMYLQAPPHPPEDTRFVSDLYIINQTLTLPTGSLQVHISLLSFGVFLEILIASNWHNWLVWEKEMPRSMLDLYKTNVYSKTRTILYPWWPLSVPGLTGYWIWEFIFFLLFKPLWAPTELYHS